MKKSFLKYYLPKVLFNIFEIIVILGAGILFGLNFEYILAIIIAFILNKIIFGESLHYKEWYLCIIWTILLFCSYYLLAKIDIKIAIFSTISFVFFSKKTNIKDLNSLFFWGGNTLNNQVFDWVKFNQSNQKLLRYENDLKENDKQKFFIFKYRFREFKSYKEISELMDMDIQRISDELKVISHFIEYSIRLDN